MWAWLGLDLAGERSTSVLSSSSSSWAPGHRSQSHNQRHQNIHSRGLHLLFLLCKAKTCSHGGNANMKSIASVLDCSSDATV